MNLPSDFGDYWPSGDFEYDTTTGDDGWWERLNCYFREQMPEEQKKIFENSGMPSYAGSIFQKFVSELGSKSTEGLLFTPVESHEPPQSFNTDRSYETLASLIKLNGRIIAVDDALKDLIERLEPRVHGFFPIEIVMPRGVLYPNKYYTLVIGQWFESFSREKSKPGSWSDYGPEYPEFFYYRYDKSKKAMAGLAFASTVFGTAHLWRERRFREDITCFSDQLQDEIMQAGLRMPKLNKMKEV